MQVFKGITVSQMNRYPTQQQECSPNRVKENQWYLPLETDKKLETRLGLDN